MMVNRKLFYNQAGVQIYSEDMARYMESMCEARLGEG